MKTEIRASVLCPSCSCALYCTIDYMFCYNDGCELYNKRFEYPMVELEPYNPKTQEVQVEIRIEVPCPACGYAFYRSDNSMFCVNQQCEKFEVPYQFPTIGLKPFEETEDD